MVTQLILKRLGEFLSKTDRDTVAHLPATVGREEEVWVYSLDNANYGFFFSVHTKDGKVVDIQARRMEWIRRHLGFDKYVEPPDFVKEAVSDRVEFVEDPNALAILDTECVKCNEEYQVDVTPKIDLLIDGRVGQRMIEEYCPDCGYSLTQRQTFNPPKQYEAEFHNENAPPEHQFDPEEVDISAYTWKHARR
ncbi:hypothetical protein [Salinirussus salinus]|uniref:hypothetical protein n=1 Tax=Salinirussus salinus TaxID=1198300 RepID=UPI0013573ABB|nr:hypothetical protein [Salinirussus salinus]